MDTRHEQVEVQYNGETIKVDEGLKELLQLLWDRRINTLFSCQGDSFFKDENQFQNQRHRAYILMERSPDSRELVVELLRHFPPFKTGEGILWDLEFDSHNIPQGRITLRFPNADIDKLVDYLRI